MKYRLLATMHVLVYIPSSHGVEYFLMWYSLLNIVKERPCYSIELHCQFW